MRRGETARCATFSNACAAHAGITTFAANGEVLLTFNARPG